MIATIGTRVEQGGADAGDEVRGARAGRAQADADPAGGPGVAVGRVGAALLVADEDVAQLGVVAQDVVEGQDHAAGIAEEDVDALAEERLAHDVGADPGPLERLRVVEHLLAGRSIGGRLGGPVVRARGSCDSAARPGPPVIVIARGRLRLPLVPVLPRSRLSP